jgi:hypothetical protein
MALAASFRQSSASLMSLRIDALLPILQMMIGERFK